MLIRCLYLPYSLASNQTGLVAGFEIEDDIADSTALHAGASRLGIHRSNASETQPRFHSLVGTPPWVHENLLAAEDSAVVAPLVGIPACVKLLEVPPLGFLILPLWHG